MLKYKLKTCKFSIEQNSYALEYVEEQTEEICQLTVNQNHYALEYVKEQYKKNI